MKGAREGAEVECKRIEKELGGLGVTEVKARGIERERESRLGTMKSK